MRWIVDPIDGTVNYLYGIPQYAVSIAAEDNGTVVAGVVLDVASGGEYAASLGGGAAHNGVPLSVRGPAPMAERLVLTGFNYERRPARSRPRRLPGCCRRCATSVGSGRAPSTCATSPRASADAYVEEGLAVWDHAAGGLVAREAGGDRRGGGRPRRQGNGHLRARPRLRGIPLCR